MYVCFNIKRASLEYFLILFYDLYIFNFNFVNVE